MTFKANGALFKNTPEKLQERFKDRYDPSRNYPAFDGVFSIKEEDRMAFASYVMNAGANDRGEIPIKISGWTKQAASSGQNYLSLAFEPDYKTMKAIEEKMAASGAADSLAKATTGQVVEFSEADLF
jgi:hypothetical protein